MSHYNVAPCVPVLTQKHQGYILIIFTVTNTLTHQIYVGSTRNDLEDQWEKMVAAAEQDLDYPLYRDIRRYGTDIFHREVYDMAESRAELAELEQNAVQELNAISLRGHKTSTVIIKKKTQVRRKASDAEKELLDLLDSFATDEMIDDLPIEELSPKKKEGASVFGELAREDNDNDRVVKPTVATQTNAAKANNTTTSVSKSKTSALMLEQVRQITLNESGKFDALAAAKTIIAQAAKEEEARAAAAKAEAEAAVERSKRTSRTNGKVSIDLNLDDSINAQLAAITAAVDSVLAGDTSAANNLETLIFAPAETHTRLPSTDSLQPRSAPLHENLAVEQTATIEDSVSEPVKKISEKEQRIIDAMARHRIARSQRSGATLENEVAVLRAQLIELNDRVAAMAIS